MLHDILYIHDVDTTEMQEGYLYVVIPHLQEPHGLLKLYNSINQGSHFCLYLKKEIDNKVAFTNSLISFFFHSGYIKERGFPVVIIDKELSSTNLLNELRVAAKIQGYEQLVIKIINEDVSFFSLRSSIDINAAYKKKLFEPGHNTHFFVVELGNAVSANYMQQQFVNEEAVFAENEREQFLYKIEAKELYERLMISEQLLSAAKRELEHKDQFIRIIKSGSQATLLQQYYTNEYEVLPKWFKQFGHIVKVLIGKRSFRSLFKK
jgi:hypothetical protein